MVARALVAGYRSAGHRVHWLAADVRSAPHATAPDDVPLRAWNLTEARLGFPWPLPGPAGSARILNAVRDADVVHIHDCLYPASQIGFRLARALKRPVLVTQHVGTVPYRSRTRRALQSAAFRTVGDSMLAAADQVVFVNRAVRDEFVGRVRFGRSPRIIENGIDLELFQPGGPPPNRRSALFVGRFVEKKGLDLIRLLAEADPDTRWLLVGRPGEVKPKEWGLANVEVVGEVAQGRLPEIYRSVSVLVLPAVGEGFPLSVQEALCCGTPVVVPTALAGTVRLPGLIGAQVTVRAFLASIEHAQNFDRAAIAAAARARWSWETAVADYLAVLNQLTDARRG